MYDLGRRHPGLVLAQYGKDLAHPLLLSSKPDKYLRDTLTMHLRPAVSGCSLVQPSRGAPADPVTDRDAPAVGRRRSKRRAKSVNGDDLCLRLLGARRAWLVKSG